MDHKKRERSSITSAKTSIQPKLRTKCTSGAAARINRITRPEEASRAVEKESFSSKPRGNEIFSLSKLSKNPIKSESGAKPTRRYQTHSGIKPKVMLQRLTNYNNIRRINCRPVTHEIPSASLMARPNVPAHPLTKKLQSHATSTPLSRRARFDFESDFNSSSSSISDISTTEESESEQTTVIRVTPVRRKKETAGEVERRDLENNNDEETKSRNPRVNSKELTANTSPFSYSESTIQNSCLSNKLTSKVGGAKGWKKLRFNIPSDDQLTPSRVHSSKSEETRTFHQEDSNDATLCASDAHSIQLLHPDWRKIPWKDYFGWTEAHETLMKKLKNEMTSGGSIYYRDEEAYEAARRYWADVQDPEEFLGGPTVTSVVEMLEVLRQKRDKGSFCYIPRRSPRRRSSWDRSGYESDSE